MSRRPKYDVEHLTDLIFNGMSLESFKKVARRIDMPEPYAITFYYRVMKYVRMFKQFNPRETEEITD